MIRFEELRALGRKLIPMLLVALLPRRILAATAALHESATNCAFRCLDAPAGLALTQALNIVQGPDP